MSGRPHRVSSHARKSVFAAAVETVCFASRTWHEILIIGRAKKIQLWYGALLFAAYSPLRNPTNFEAVYGISKMNKVALGPLFIHLVFFVGVSVG